MPLHLLGKKSWNVYNPANIARVRRDEEAAQAREEADEQRMQEVDADRRLAILRGETPPPLQDPEPDTSTAAPPRDHGTGRKRKRNGEDDTDFEMRLARERASAGDRPVRELAVAKPAAASPTSLVDSKGHIALFAEPEAPRRHGEKNPEAMREAARKERELKDQYQMRLVNAAGKEGEGLTHGGPWYASADGEAVAALVPSKNVWGRDDPRRKVRAAARLDASDPLAMMKSGAKMVRELNRERKKEVEERERELRALEKDERREEKRRERKRRREEEEGDRRRGRRRDSADRDGGSKSERSRPRDEADRERKRDRSEGRDQNKTGRRGEPLERLDRSRRHDQERRRGESREGPRRRDDKYESRCHDRHLSHPPPHGRDRHRERQR